MALTYHQCAYQEQQEQEQQINTKRLWKGIGLYRKKS